MMNAGAQAAVFLADSLGLRDGWFRTSDGVRLHYLVGGSGRTVVFVPGWTMPAEIWAPQLRHFFAEHLARLYRKLLTSHDVLRFSFCAFRAVTW